MRLFLGVEQRVIRFLIQILGKLEGSGGDGGTWGGRNNLIYRSTAATSKRSTKHFPHVAFVFKSTAAKQIGFDNCKVEQGQQKNNFQRLPGQEGGKGKVGHELNSFWFTLASRKHTLVERAPLRENRLAFSPLFLFSSLRRGLELPRMSLG